MSDFRKLINLFEKSLTAAELTKHSGQYLKILIQFVGNGLPVPVDPAYRDEFGDNIQIDPAMLPALEAALNSDNISANLPKKVQVVFNGKKVSAPWGLIFKGKEFTGIAGKKAYNAGHLAELIMGLSISAKFLNLGADITVEQLMAMIGYITPSIQGTNYRFSHVGNIQYPESKAKNDLLNFVAIVPPRSAEAFLEQAQSGRFESDIAAVLASAVRYCNESEGVQNACERVRKDTNSNNIEVISDGSSDAKGTKADLQLKVDGSKINLLSLKTFSTETLGQISGLGYEQVSKWFDVAFGIDVSEYQGLLDPTLPKEKIYSNLLNVIYDEVVYPQVERMVNDQSPGKEAMIVKRLARAALFHARGESMEDLEVVKLDDSISSGNYKILKFSDDLEEAMTHLDLETKLVGKGQGRTIQIWIKPAEGEKVARGSNKLCQFRTQKMGDSYRNYYEIGPMMEVLTRVERRAEQPQAPKAAGASLSADRVKRPGKLKFQEPIAEPIMRAKRS